MGQEGAILDFQSDGEALTVVWVDGPDYSVLPGTVVGRAVPAAKAGEYDCTFFADPRNGKAHSSSKKIDMVLRLDAATGHTFVLQHYQRNFKADLWRLVPRYLRIGLRRNDTRPTDLDGARRLDAPAQFIVL